MAEYQLPLADASIDMALAFSLFTHLNQPDAAWYFREMARVIKPGGCALFTFFLLDDRYDRADHSGTRWDFDRTIDDQPEWHWTSYFKIPERQIAVTPAGVDHLMGSDFTLEKVYAGWWTGHPAAFLQDTLIFRRQG